MNAIISRSKLLKDWKFFDIMHKERRVARIFGNGRCIINYPSFMPYNLYLETGNDFDNCVNNLNNFYYWCSSRVLTLDRKYAKEILAAIGANQAVTDRDRAMIAISYHGLSLTDVFWIKGPKEKITYNQVNLFSHSLSEAFTNVCLRGKAITIQNAELLMSRNTAGDLSAQGIAPKAWIRENDTFYLLKDGDERDVDAEILASKITDCFDVNHVSYSEYSFDNARVSRCEIITSPERGIVPFEYIDIYCVNKEKDKNKFVLSKDKYSYYMMNIIDYLVGNTDRHWGNWGFYVDNATNKLLRLYPLMDFNKAFTVYDTIDGSVCQTTPQRVSQRAAAIEAVNKIGLNQISEVKPEWFVDDNTKDMFFKRLEILKSASKQI